MNDEEPILSLANLFASSPTRSNSSNSEDFQSTSEQESIGDQTFIKTLIPAMSTSLPPTGTGITVTKTNPTAFGSRRFQIASSMVNTLSKISVTEKLTDTNYPNWSSEISIGTRSLSLYSFLLSDKDETPINDDTKLFNEVVRDCLTTWMISKLDQPNRNRFEPSITVESELESTPSKLWIKIRDHHSPRTPAHQMLLRRYLFNLKQGTLSLPIHMDEFHCAYIAYCSSGGTIGSVEVGQQLLMSLNSDWMKVAEDIADNNTFEYDSVVTALKVRITNRAMLHSATTSIPLAESSAASPMRRRQGFVQTRCTPKKCVSLTHSQADCIRDPRNKDKYNAWVEAKKAKGEWVERTPPSSSSNVSSTTTNPSASFTTSNSEPSLSLLQAALDRSEFNASASAVHIVEHNAGFETEHFGIVDSGTTHHMFKLEKYFNKDTFVNIPADNQQQVGLAGGTSTLQILGRGNVTMIGPTGDTITLSDCLFVPSLKQNLIAGGRLFYEGWITNRRDDGTFVIQRNGITALTGKVHPTWMLLQLNVATQILHI